MKRYALLITGFLTALSSFAQHKAKKQEAFYMLDANLKGTTQQKAVFFIHAQKLRDSCWQFDTYNISGPMISSEQYKDEKATLIHGQCIYFNARGTRDSIGHFDNGLPDGSFYYLNDTGKIYIEKRFKKGVLAETIDRIKQDAIDEAVAKSKKDTTIIEKESSFAGGIPGWGKYLTRNLVYPQRAQQLQKEGTVAVQFIVDTDGHILEQEIVQSVEFSLDQEAMRMIAESPNWISAYQNGKKVKSYKKQPITFKLQ